MVRKRDIGRTIRLPENGIFSIEKHENQQITSNLTVNFNKQ